MKTNLKPYIIQMVINGVDYNFHGCEKLSGRPYFFNGYASLDTNCYFRTYKHCKNAIREGKKIHSYFQKRGLLKDKQIRIVNMIDDSVVMVLA